MQPQKDRAEKGPKSPPVAPLGRTEGSPRPGVSATACQARVTHAGPSRPPGARRGWHQGSGLDRAQGTSERKEQGLPRCPGLGEGGGANTGEREQASGAVLDVSRASGRATEAFSRPRALGACDVPASAPAALQPPGRGGRSRFTPAATSAHGAQEPARRPPSPDSPAARLRASGSAPPPPSPWIIRPCTVEPATARSPGPVRPLPEATRRPSVPLGLERRLSWAGPRRVCVSAAHLSVRPAGP